MKKTHTDLMLIGDFAWDRWPTNTHAGCVWNWWYLWWEFEVPFRQSLICSCADSSMTVFYADVLSHLNMGNMILGNQRSIFIDIIGIRRQIGDSWRRTLFPENALRWPFTETVGPSTNQLGFSHWVLLLFVPPLFHCAVGFDRKFAGIGSWSSHRAFEWSKGTSSPEIHADEGTKTQLFMWEHFFIKGDGLSRIRWLCPWTKPGCWNREGILFWLIAISSLW